MKQSISKKTLGYAAVFSPAEEGGYVVSFPDFPGCATEGDTFEKAKANAAEILALWIEELTANHETIPTRFKRPIVDEVEVAVAF